MKNLLIVLLVTLCPYIQANAAGKVKITEATNLDTLKTVSKHADGNTLVIFDVQEVLMIARDQILNPLYRPEYYELINKMNADLSKEEKERLHSIILAEYKVQLVDPELLNILVEVKATGAKVIALTSGFTGRYGTIDKREDLRLEKLKELGIDFSDSFPNISSITFKDIKGANPAHPPMFKGGIIFVAKASKGEILEAFLEKEKIHPSKIIFFDNQIKNLLTVKAFCEKAKIDFEGVHYTQVMKRKKLPLDIPKAIYQFKVLREENKWLSDEEASKRMTNNAR